MMTTRHGVSRKVLINSILLVLFLMVAIVLFFLLRENAPPLLDAAVETSHRRPADLTRASVLS